MRRKLFYSLNVLMLLTLTIISCGFQKNQPSPSPSPSADLPEVGTLTAYYATEDFAVGENQYKSGQLICDSNDPINRIVDLNANAYKYEGDEGGETYSWELPKSKVKKVTYKMSQLPVSMVGEKAVFKSKQGLIATIFKADINGHKFFSWVDGDNGFKAVYNEEETQRHNEFLVLNAEFVPSWTDETQKWETPINTKDGYIDMYQNNRYSFGEDTEDCRYREGLIGIVEEEWVNKEGWEEAAYSDDGKLLVDQYSIDGSIPEYFSVAYIADKDALYFNGTLYYRQP